VRSGLLAALALLLAGCGQSGPTDEDLVRRTVLDFGQATAAKDYRSLCRRILAPALVEEVRSIGLPCEVALEQGLGEVREPRLTVGRISIDGDRASAQVETSAANQEPSRDTLRLERVNGQWRVASLGSAG
jgi:hypothetical protein